MKNKFLFRLYITGLTKKNEKLIEEIRSIFRSRLKESYEFQVMDVLKDAQMAEEDKILATPTLLRKRPLPVRRILGGLKDKEKILKGLDLYKDRERQQR